MTDLISALYIVKRHFFDALKNEPARLRIKLSLFLHLSSMYCICSFQFRWRSKIIPRNFTELSILSVLPSSLRGLFTWTFILLVKMTPVLFVVEILKPHFSHHSWILFKLICILFIM